MEIIASVTQSNLLSLSNAFNLLFLIDFIDNAFYLNLTFNMARMTRNHSSHDSHGSHDWLPRRLGERRLSTPNMIHVRPQ